jgi:Protein of unknown function (DUF3987)
VMSGQVVASFIYHDESGKAVARIDRIEPGRNGRGKDFFPYLFLGTGVKGADTAGFALKSGVNGMTLPLYHVPDVLRVAQDGGVAFFAEGEGKADKLKIALKTAKISAAVTTCAFGANTDKHFTPHLTQFAGFTRIVILADSSDNAGRPAAKRRAQLFADAHPQTEVRLLDFFPKRNDDADVSDWLAQGHGADELRVLVEAAPIITPASTPTVLPSASYEENELDEISPLQAQTEFSTTNEGSPPKPLWEDLTPPPTLHPAALYGLAGAVVNAIEPETEADKAALLFTLLTRAGAMIGHGPFLRVGRQMHTPRLFTVIVGDSATSRKGTSYSEITAVLEKADTELVDTTHVSGLSTGEGLIAHLHDREDGKPVEKRVLDYEPEFVRILNVCARDNATLSAIMRQGWDGVTLRVMTRNNPLHAKNAFIAFLGHITQEELTPKLTSIETANGFANRMLFVFVTRSKLLADGGYLPPETIETLGERVRTMLDAARKIGEVRRSTAFAAAYKELYEERKAFLGESGLFGALTARGDANTLRLSLHHCLLNGADTLQLEHLVAGYAAWKYVEDSERYIFGRKLGDDTQQRLLDELRAVHPEGLDKTQQHNLFGRNASAAKLNDAREKLLARNLVAEKIEATDGRSRSVLVAVPYDKNERSKTSTSDAHLFELLNRLAESQGDREVFE